MNIRHPRSFLIVIIVALKASIALGIDSKGMNEILNLDNLLVSVEYVPILDGGTIGLTIRDVTGNTGLISIDKQNIEVQLTEPFENYTKEVIEKLDGMRLRCVYIGSLHPTHENAKRVPFKSIYERQIVEKIESLRDHNPEYSDVLNIFLDEIATERIRGIRMKIQSLETEQ